MKRACLISSVLGVLGFAALPSTALANPAILYVPSEDIMLEGCTMTNSGNNCINGEGGMVTAFAGDLDALTTGLSDALAPYDVLVTSTRPPDYVPFTLFMPSDEPTDPMADPPAINPWCASSGINCGARKRNNLLFTNGGTTTCMDPDPVHSALYAVGRAFGLEASDVAMDPMISPPDFTMPATTYQDMCGARIQQVDDMMMMVPLECTTADHVNECADGEQNSHAELLDLFGARTTDADPPVLTLTSPMEGQDFAVGDVIPLAVTIDDADVNVGGRWTIESAAFPVDQVPDGIITICTNQVCDFEWANEPFFRAPGADWSFSGLQAPAAGTYTITFEAADMHGNVAEAATVTVTAGGGGDGMTTMETGTPDDGMLTTGADSTGDGTPADGGDDGDSGGCSCTQSQGTGGAAFFLVGLIGLGLARRRRA